jgi:hypothetical protein
MMDKPNGILTFTTAGKSHLEIEWEFYEMLARVARDAVKAAERGELPKVNRRSHTKTGARHGD